MNTDPAQLFPEPLYALCSAVADGALPAGSYCSDEGWVAIQPDGSFTRDLFAVAS